MAWILNPYMLALVVSAGIAGAVGVYALLHSKVPGAAAYSASAFIVAGWAVSNILEKAAVDLGTKVFWANVQYVEFGCVPVLWLIAALRMTGRDQWLTSRAVVLPAIVPAITSILAWTNDLHGLLWSDPRIATVAGLSVIAQTYGLWFWVHAAYSYSLILTGVLVLAQSIERAHGFLRTQPILLLSHRPGGTPSRQLGVRLEAGGHAPT
ncbi:MAG: hypothetical protein NUW23_03645 [Firmicutes bacterium]|nr:hypothetical protein [Bacillota bacterium]